MKDQTDCPELALKDINPLNPHLFREDRWHDHFARLRAEDPIHFNELTSAGRYWSVTKWDDIREVESNAELFSSAHGIAIGRPIALERPAALQTTSFIGMDPPEHGPQRKTVQPMLMMNSLRNLENLIRERAIDVIESLPEGETFDWVDTVSVELTTLMLATLFDFPLERVEDRLVIPPGPEDRGDDVKHGRKGTLQLAQAVFDHGPIRLE